MQRFLRSRQFSFTNLLVCFSVPLEVLSCGLEPELLLKTFSCYGIIDWFYEEMPFVKVGPHLHAAPVGLHYPVWDAVVKVVVRDHVVQVYVPVDDVHVLVSLSEDYSAGVDDLRFVRLNRGHNVVVVQPRVSLKRETAIVRRRPEDHFYPFTG